MDIHDLQATVTAGSCSSRVIFNVPQGAEPAGSRSEIELLPNRNFDFALSASFNDAKLRSTLTSTDPSGVVTSCGNRERPAAADRAAFQSAAAATFQWDVRDRCDRLRDGIYQHIGSRFTQVGDQDLGR